MAKRPDLTGHQKKIVNRYYENRDTISTTKLAEVISSLYLEDDPKKSGRLWKSAETALVNLGVAGPVAASLVAARDVRALAEAAEKIARDGGGAGVRGPKTT
ncbi:MAG: hypothetical protein KF757_13365 [Phycisphaeraceae bacterium]|nr:hypothetical protein [Phycisphaeraceae bacterium]MCW5763950.1 hypothetical protein [Phycisphaeraceae bacterium]